MGSSSSLLFNLSKKFYKESIRKLAGCKKHKNLGNYQCFGWRNRSKSKNSPKYKKNIQKPKNPKNSKDIKKKNEKPFNNPKIPKIQKFCTTIANLCWRCYRFSIVVKNFGILVFFGLLNGFS